MKTLALVIALVACTGANAESIPGVRPSEPNPVMLVPPALVTAAVPSVRIAPEGNTAAKSTVPESGLQGGCAVDAAVAKAQTFPESSATQSAEPGVCRIDEVALDETDGMSPSVALEDAKTVQEAEPRKTGTMPVPKSEADCTLVGIYAKRRMLSGPWSASRRLEAARIRGDADEAKRMEAMLDDFVGKAISEEAP